MHVCFPKPLMDIHELNEGLPSVEYKLEAQRESQPVLQTYSDDSALWCTTLRLIHLYSTFISWSCCQQEPSLKACQETCWPLFYLAFWARFGSQQDESDWKQIDRTLIYCDESTNMVTAAWCARNSCHGWYRTLEMNRVIDLSWTFVDIGTITIPFLLFKCRIRRHWASSGQCQC